MNKPGTNEVLVLRGVAVTTLLEEVFKDFMMHKSMGTKFGEPWTPIFYIAYENAQHEEVVRHLGDNRYTFTDKGKSIFGLWLLLIESGAHQHHKVAP